uniref:Uncharacterized protein n=1 Tax=Timema genevievae TaxID=629358 RepID=A0A7R9JN92_TIMGE|nr:unnamed protein product [Timema genevievae]
MSEQVSLTAEESDYEDQLFTRTTPDRDSNPDIPVIGSPVYCESDTLDHSTTELVGHLLVRVRVEGSLEEMHPRQYGERTGNIQLMCVKQFPFHPGEIQTPTSLSMAINEPKTLDRSVPVLFKLNNKKTFTASARAAAVCWPRNCQHLWIEGVMRSSLNDDTEEYACVDVKSIEKEV